MIVNSSLSLVRPTEGHLCSDLPVKVPLGRSCHCFQLNFYLASGRLRSGARFGGGRLRPPLSQYGSFGFGGRSRQALGLCPPVRGSRNVIKPSNWSCRLPP